MIQNPPDLLKLSFDFLSQNHLIFLGFYICEYEGLHAFGSHVIYNILVRTVSDIQSLDSTRPEYVYIYIYIYIYI